MNFKSVFTLVLLGIFIIVCIQNVEPVPVHLLFWKFEISKLLLLIITLIVGIITGMMIPGFIKNSKEVKPIEKE